MFLPSSGTAVHAVKDVRSTAERYAHYHELEVNALRLQAKMGEILAHLDAYILHREMKRLQGELEQQVPFQRQYIADAISQLRLKFDLDSPHGRLETVRAQLEEQQLRENAEIAEYRRTLAHISPAQTLFPDLLSEIFERCGYSSPQLSLPWVLRLLNPEMGTLLTLLRVCSMWRAVALQTPSLWCRFECSAGMPWQFYDLWARRAAAVPLIVDMHYRNGAKEFLDTNCAAIETLSLRSAGAYHGGSISPLFPHPYRPIRLRRLIIHPYYDNIHPALSNIPWSQLSSLEIYGLYDSMRVLDFDIAGILSQARNLGHLVLQGSSDHRYHDLQPGGKALLLPKLRTMNISCLVHLLPNFRAPALRQLDLCFSSYLHVTSASMMAFLRELRSLTSLRWKSDDRDFSELVQALTDHRLGSDTLLPNLVDISLELSSYDGLLPAFADMIASRWWPGEMTESQSQTIRRLNSFRLFAYVSESEFDRPRPLPPSEKEANADASRRLQDFVRQGLQGSLDFQHSDQILFFPELVETGIPAHESPRLLISEEIDWLGTSEPDTEISKWLPEPGEIRMPVFIPEPPRLKSGVIDWLDTDEPDTEISKWLG